MDAFYGSNPGLALARRAPHRVPGLRARRAAGDRAADAGRSASTSSATTPATALRAYVERRRDQPRFANARSLRNAIDRARLRHAGRLFAAAGAPSRSDLVTIEADDILRSSVFASDPLRRPVLAPSRSSSASSATPPPARPRSRAGSCGCWARTTSPTSRPTTTTATTASSAPSAASRRWTPSATTWTSWSSTSPRCARGAPILKPVYRHQDGTFGPPVYVTPRRFTIVEGLLGYHTARLRDVYDVRVYLSPPEDLRRQWKVDRDCSRRGYTTDQVLEELDRREADSAGVIRPQERFADIVVAFAPGERRRSRPARRASSRCARASSTPTSRSTRWRSTRASASRSSGSRATWTRRPARRSRRRSGTASTSPATCAPNGSGSSRSAPSCTGPNRSRWCSCWSSTTSSRRAPRCPWAARGRGYD